MGEKIKIKKISKVPKKNIQDVDFTEEVNNIIDDNSTETNEQVIDEPVASETINIEEKQSISDEQVEMDFMDEKNLEQFAQKGTKEAEPIHENKVFDEGTTEELRNQILSEEKIKSESFSPKDMRQIAQFMINIFDSGIGMALKAWSGDSSTSAYQLPKPSKDQLTDQLTLILIKHGAKFKIEVLFIVGLCLAYAPQFKAAYDKRQEIKKTVEKPQQQQQQQTENKSEEKKTTREVIKRHRGRPRKQ